jgi:hypothetical protein
MTYEIRVTCNADGSDTAVWSDLTVKTANGSVSKLGREIARSGHPDGPWVANGGEFSGPSIYRMACRTYGADGTIGLWAPYPPKGQPIPELDDTFLAIACERQAASGIKAATPVAPHPARAALASV